jgi:4-amino-4-deoxy-L-arabinose transferase-like glycosyltransferase
MMSAQPIIESDGNSQPVGTTGRRFVQISFALLALHVFFMLFRYGQLPIVPVVGDEVIINDASVSLARGQGYAARSFAGSQYGLDRVFAHFPPLYPYTEALAFKLFGVSVYSLRLTATLVSIGSTIVLFFILLRLCRKRLLDWNAALLIEALYCTNASLISLERVARMESMIGLLMFLSLAAVLYMASQPEDAKTWPSMLAAGLFGALCLAVHPEALTALLLLGALMFLLGRANLPLRLVSVGLFGLIPLVVGLVIFGRKLPTAVEQFLKIAHDSASTEPTTMQHLHDALHNTSLSILNRNLFLLLILMLMALAPVVYAVVTRKLPHHSLRYKMGVCLAVVCVLEIVLMFTIFRLDDRRCQFLFGPLLLCIALCLLGNKPLRRWQTVLGWTVVALQCSVAGFYLSARNDRAADMDPNRYAGLIQRLPSGVSIASTPGLWLDFEQAQRPFTLIFYGLDGENTWTNGVMNNPLERFDIIILESYYTEDKPWWAQEAAPGRKKYTYTVGRDVVDVYVRGNSTWKP